jgi:hypothetical protein
MYTYALGALVGVGLANNGRATDGECRAGGDIDDLVGRRLKVAAVLAFNVAGLKEQSALAEEQ